MSDPDRRVSQLQSWLTPDICLFVSCTVRIIADGFERMTNEERLDVLGLYCPGCGAKKAECSCEKPA